MQIAGCLDETWLSGAELASDTVEKEFQTWKWEFDVLYQQKVKLRKFFPVLQENSFTELNKLKVLV